MFGFHSRSRSLIPVKDMEKMEEKRTYEEAVLVEEVEQMEPQTPRQRRNLTMIYLLFLAEAIMAASLTSQINIIFPSATACLDMNTSFLHSILQCAYYFGSASGIMWGLVADRIGRRNVAMTGLLGMSTCCISMAFATDFTTFCILRYLAGAISAAVTVSGMAMLADATHGNKSRTTVVARLPMIAVCGQLGPILSNSIHHFAQQHLEGIFERYPALSGQVACGMLVLSITVAELFLLDETLPRAEIVKEEDFEVDCEKAAFLAPRSSADSEDSLAITIMEALNDETSAKRRPSSISISQMLTAPSVILLLASFSVLSLHSSTFEVILPHIGHTEAHNGGMGLPCTWLHPILLVVRVIAAVRIMHFVPFLVSRVGLIPMYQRTSLIFPLLYIIIPVVALAVNATGASPIISAIISTFATLAKTTFAGAAQTLVLILVMSAAPDASSTGTLVGVISISELFKALAVGLAGMSYYLSDDYSMLVINGSLWASLAIIALIGALMTRSLREGPRLGTDLPAECFVWQGVFDAESDEEAGF